jgi:putative ABC transport system permease protein
MLSCNRIRWWHGRHENTVLDMKTLRNTIAWLTRESGVRYLMARRMSCVVAVATMALALGANTLVFAISKAFLLASFALPEPDRLFVIAPVRELPGRGDVVFAEAYANYARLREAQRSFEDVTVMLQSVASWDTGEEARPLLAARVTASFFATTRVRPALGRPFEVSEEGPGAAPVAMISHALWRSAFSSDPAAVGSTMRINGAAHTVIGVMPPGFTHPLPTDLWLPFDLNSPTAWTAVTGGRNLSVYGRLEDGVSLAAARAEMNRLTALAVEATPDNQDFRYTLQSIRQVLVPGIDRVVAFVQAGAVLLVLLATGNLAALLVAWGFDRRTELAVRLALGAGGRRIIAMLILQATLVVMTGGVAGVLLSAAMLPLVRNLDVGTTLGIYFAELRIDALVLAVTALVIAIAGIIAGLLPAWFAARSDPGDALRSSGRALSLPPAALHAQRAMLLVQTAFSVTLVCVAVAIGLSFRNLSRVDTGFDVAGVVVARVQLPPTPYGTVADRATFGAALLEHLSREPALRAWGFTSTLPVGDQRWGGRFFIDENDIASDNEPLLLHIRRVSAGYTDVIGIPLLNGRNFDMRDGADGVRVALISRSLATRLWPDEDPLGRRIHRVQAGAPPEPLEIIGVVGDVPDGGLQAPAGETVYVHWPQISIGQMSIVATGSGGVESTLAAIRRALRATDASIAASSSTTLAALVREANALPRLATLLLGVFAIAAIAMVLLGAYGGMTQLVLSREREFAVRLLFGARPIGIAAAVLVQAARIILAGTVCGVLAVWLLGSLLEPLLFGVRPRSVGLIGGVSAVVLLLHALGVAPAARRAARVELRKGIA